MKEEVKLKEQRKNTAKEKKKIANGKLDMQTMKTYFK